MRVRLFPEHRPGPPRGLSSQSSPTCDSAPVSAPPKACFHLCKVGTSYPSSDTLHLCQGDVKGLRCRDAGGRAGWSGNVRKMMR